MTQLSKFQILVGIFCSIILTLVSLIGMSIIFYISPPSEPGIIVDFSEHWDGEQVELGAVNVFDKTPITMKFYNLHQDSYYTLAAIYNDKGEDKFKILMQFTDYSERIITFQATDMLLILFRDGKVTLTIRIVPDFVEG